MNPLTLSPGIGDNRPTATLYYGQDVRESLRLLPEKSVHAVCTSPPFWGLRDYGTGDKQIGLEDSPQEFVDSLVEVFREVKRVLRPDGTLWLNLGDSYTAGGRGGHASSDTFHGHKGRRGLTGVRKPPKGLKTKDLVGIPWRVALALQDDGWYLRSDIIWAKSSPMPESVKDRPTKAHEYVFLFAPPDSRGKYYYDQDAIREPLRASSRARNKYGWKGAQRTRDPREQRDEPDRDHCFDESVGSNKRTVWNVNAQPYRGAHFAVWPPELVKPMILAGTSSHGCCSGCGAPWKRDTKRTSTGYDGSQYGENVQKAANGAKSGGTAKSTLGSSGGTLVGKYSTTGWSPTCSCSDEARKACVVLDPFSGSATTGMVALQEGRDYVGIDLNGEYLDLATARIRGDKAPRQPESGDESLSVFDLFGN